MMREWLAPDSPDHNLEAPDYCNHTSTVRLWSSSCDWPKTWRRWQWTRDWRTVGCSCYWLGCRLEEKTKPSITSHHTSEIAHDARHCWCHRWRQSCHQLCQWRRMSRSSIAWPKSLARLQQQSKVGQTRSWIRWPSRCWGRWWQTDQSPDEVGKCCCWQDKWWLGKRTWSERQLMWSRCSSPKIDLRIQWSLGYVGLMMMSAHDTVDDDTYKHNTLHNPRHKYQMKYLLVKSTHC